MPDRPTLPRFLRTAAVAALVAVGAALFGAHWPLTTTQPSSCRVWKVVDGDTLDALCAGWPPVVRVRIADIDAPKRAGCPAQAERATQALAALLDGQPVEVTPLYTDPYDRTVARVTVDGRDVGAAMLATRHARPWPHDTRGRATAPRPEGCE